MNKKRIFTILLVTILVVQFTIAQTNQSSAIFNDLIIKNTSGNSPSMTIITPDAPPGMEVIKSNIFYNGGFETNESNGAPSNIWASGSGFAEIDCAYQADVYAGTYGAYMNARGTLQSYAYAYVYRSLTSYMSERAYLDEDIELDFFLNVTSNPDAYGQIILTLYFTTNLGSYYMYYYLAANSLGGGNTTNYGYIDVRTPINTWTQLTRNVTHDLLQSVTTSPDPSLSYLREIQIYCSSPNNPSGDVNLLFDEFSITNGTAFNYMIDNGDFEDGDGSTWGVSESGPGSVLRTTADKTQGNSAMNLTARSTTANSYANARAYRDVYYNTYTIRKGYPVYQPGDVEISFDWKYSDPGTGLGSHEAYFYFDVWNETDRVRIYYYFGNENDLFLGYYGNDTTGPYYYYRFAAPDFGVQDTWNTINFDLYTLLTDLNLTNMVLTYFRFNIYVGYGVDLKNQLLIDDFKITTYPAGDLGFEADYGVAHTGNFAANMSSYNSAGSRYCYRYTYLPITNNLFTDFWWRLDKLSPTGGSAYSFIRLQLDSNYNLNYIVGSNGVTFINDSNNCYYLVEQLNQTGSWQNLFRNISKDIEHFGVANMNITQIRVEAYSTGTSEIVTLFDDLH
ncbi:MAG: hypothetical protein ACTSP5_14205, partial [Candidatus Heimdallarchaeota archaeon]